MKVSKIKQEMLSVDVVDSILFDGLDDKGLTGDCVMVLGSRSAVIYRVPKAVDIYNSGRCDTLLMTGGRVLNYDTGNITEASRMKNKAMDLGIPEGNILTEEISLSTKENILCSLLVLDRQFKLSNMKSILLVTTTYHMKRSLMMAKTYIPSWINVAPCPADDTNTRRDTWFLTEEGLGRAKDEACKIICYINEGSIPDFNI